MLTNAQKKAAQQNSKSKNSGKQGQSQNAPSGKGSQRPPPPSQSARPPQQLSMANADSDTNDSGCDTGKPRSPPDGQSSSRHKRKKDKDQPSRKDYSAYHDVQDESDSDGKQCSHIHNVIRPSATLSFCERTNLLLSFLN